MNENFQKLIRDHERDVGVDLHFDEEANNKAIAAFIAANKTELVGEKTQKAIDTMANKLWAKRQGK